MSLINFNEIDCKKSINNEKQTIHFNGSDIEIIKNLPIHDVNDMVNIAIQKSFEDNYCNYVKLNMYLSLYLVFTYTNIVFSAEEQNDLESLYDVLSQSGLLELVMGAIDEQELCHIEQAVKNTLESYTKYKNSLSAALLSLIDGINDKVNKGLEMMKNISPEMIDAVAQQNPQLVEMFKSKLN